MKPQNAVAPVIGAHPALRKHDDAPGLTDCARRPRGAASASGGVAGAVLGVLAAGRDEVVR